MTAIIRRLIWLRRFTRKHHLALLLLGTYLLILFFPMIYMGRVLSPNDIYYHYEPWALVRHVEAQNPVIHDPPASYLTLMSLLKSEPSSFHWNRYVASGIPGFASVASAVLSPFIAIPVLLLPLSLVYVGIIVLKVVVGFTLAYLWLREERLGKRGAAVGALIFAAAGPYMVWWLWQGTNATVLYPAVLLLIVRAFHGKRNSVVLSALLVVALLLSGFPATIAYIAWLAAAYALFLVLRYRSLRPRETAKGVAAMIIGAMICAPFIAPLVSFLRRSGYFAMRERAGYDFHYPLDQLRGFLDPFRLGDPAAHLWIGDARLAISNNFIESTVYLGLLTLILIPLGLLARGAGNRWFWTGALLIIAFSMFGDHHPIKDWVGALPGFRLSPLTRLRVLLPIPVAYLAAAGLTVILSAAKDLRLDRRNSSRRFFGASRLRMTKGIAWAVGLLITIDLALLAGRFYPFIEPRLTHLPETPTLQFLHEQQQPFRIAAFFNYLWPNSAELVRVEDIRSHFGSEEVYRQLLKRFDPGSWGGSGTVIQFNGLRANISDPVLALLGVRYLIEQPNIDIIHWRVREQTQLSGKPVNEFRLRSGETLARQLFVEPGMHAVYFDFGIGSTFRHGAKIDIELVRPETGEVVFARSWDAARLARESKVYLPVSPYARDGNVLLFRTLARGVSILIPTTEEGLLYGKVRSPIIPYDELPDGRIFYNVAELPRHWAVWNVRQAALDGPADFSREALLSQPPEDALKNLAKVTPWLRHVRLRLVEYSGTRHGLETDSAVPFLLATSEKLTPELRITIDGETVAPIRINGMFAAVRVGPGRHRIELVRRIGRGFWPVAAVGLLAMFAAAWFDVRRSPRR